jgi:hypothetical protein
MKENKNSIYKLMIKTHNITGLKYLCITQRKNYIDYTGSGVYWKNHLKTYGKDFSTELLYEDNNYDDFVKMCKFYSDFYNIVESSEFANMVPETGYNNNDGKPNVVLFWEYVKPEIKNDIIKKRNESIKNNHWTKLDKENKIYLETIEKLKLSGTKQWENFNLDERRELTSHMKEGFKTFLNDEEKVLKWKEKISDAIIKRYENYTDEEKIEIGKKISKSRLNMTPDAKQARKEKIQSLYATGKYQYLFDKMSEERKGAGNPAAKLIFWYGTVYTKMDFEKQFGKVNSKKIQNELLNNSENCKLLYDDSNLIETTITCPYCNKFNTSIKHSSFKRWHFENCKEKNEKSSKN